MKLVTSVTGDQTRLKTLNLSLSLYSYKSITLHAVQPQGTTVCFQFHTLDFSNS